MTNLIDAILRGVAIAIVLGSIGLDWGFSFSPLLAILAGTLVAFYLFRNGQKHGMGKRKLF